MVLSPQQQAELDRFPTKAARIRALRAEGFRQADIARHLGVSDQHVSNVLRRSERAGIVAERLTAVAGVAEAPAAYGAEAGAGPERFFPLTIAPDGRLTLPPALLAAMMLDPDGRVTAHVEEGELKIIAPRAAIKRIQRIARKYKKPGESVVDELIADRRAEAAREDAET